eukprot:Transcript_12926.p1 GENE.Transcript_12926~~Transcript_12926.p1  ORF type:complete len:544 (+),score=121.82 Transcript_12926:53-1633(+)
MLAPLALLPLLFLLAVRARRLAFRLLSARQPGEQLRVAFLHPDLGIGGAERLVVDAAVSLQRRGHSVVMHTAHHDAGRCFEETRDGTLAVRVAGDWLPRTVLGRLHIVCATLRALYGALVLLATEPGCDVVVVDQVSAPVPLLRLGGLVVLFYCHFPDKLLSSGAAAGAPRFTGGALKRAARWLYRLPFDLLEEVTTGCANTVLVNSRYTASVFDAAFPLLRGLRRVLGQAEPEVLHPCIDTAGGAAQPAWPGAARPVRLVSINRFEGKKNLRLAVAALRALTQEQGGKRAASVHLTLAGGWDPRLRENVECFEALQARALPAGPATHFALHPELCTPPLPLSAGHSYRKPLLGTTGGGAGGGAGGERDAAAQRERCGAACSLRAEPRGGVHALERALWHRAPRGDGNGAPRRRRQQRRAARERAARPHRLAVRADARGLRAGLRAGGGARRDAAAARDGPRGARARRGAVLARGLRAQARALPEAGRRVGGRGGARRQAGVKARRVRERPRAKDPIFDQSGSFSL